jgi:hypothetical protein
MKKIDIYKIRTLFEKILNDYTNDVAKYSDGSPHCRATKIHESVQKGIEICESYINKMEPLK